MILQMAYKSNIIINILEIVHQAPREIPRNISSISDCSSHSSDVRIVIRNSTK